MEFPVVLTVLTPSTFQHPQKFESWVVSTFRISFPNLSQILREHLPELLGPNGMERMEWLEHFRI